MNVFLIQNGTELNGFVESIIVYHMTVLLHWRMTDVLAARFFLNLQCVYKMNIVSETTIPVLIQRKLRRYQYIGQNS